MATPKAVASSVKTPGFYLTVNLLGGVGNPGLETTKALIIALKNTADGTITTDTGLVTPGSADGAGVSHGVGSMGHLMAQQLFAKNPLASVDMVAPAAGGGVAATGTHVVTGPVTENTVVRTDIAGRLIDVNWASGESVATFRTRWIATVNGYSAILPAIASAGGGGGDFVLTSKAVGKWGNDVLTGMVFLSGGTGATLTPVAALTGGTLDPSYAAVLSLIQTSEYRQIVGGMSNADFALTGATSNASRLKAHINTYNTGLDALLQIGIAGYTGSSTATFKTGAIDRNDPAFQAVFGMAFQSLPSELAACEAGSALAKIALRANYNRIGELFPSLYGPKDVVADKPTPAEVEDVLNNGGTVISLAKATNQPILVRPITTHSQLSGNPDFRCFDMTDVYGAYFVATDLRNALPLEFANASITADLPPGSDSLPAGVVERKDVYAWVLSRLALHTRSGVVDPSKLEANIAAGKILVEIDSGDPTQVNIFLPLDIIKPLAKFGMVVSKAA